MPNPKRRHSKSRRDKRRTHDALRRQTFARCTHCNQPAPPHMVCSNCGHYKGHLVMEGTEA